MRIALCNSSNRTFMELKSCHECIVWRSLPGSNRTFMELKFCLPCFSSKGASF